jgi:hypothetical protein
MGFTAEERQFTIKAHTREQFEVFDVPSTGARHARVSSAGSGGRKAGLQAGVNPWILPATGIEQY